jgi:ankyrin repeat protein
LISAPELSKHLTTSQCPDIDAANNGDCPAASHKLISLLSSGADINLCDEGGQSPLFAASMFGHCDVIKCLLGSSADINLHDKLRLHVL